MMGGIILEGKSRNGCIQVLELEVLRKDDIPHDMDDAIELVLGCAKNE